MCQLWRRWCRAHDVAAGLDVGRTCTRTQSGRCAAPSPRRVVLSARKHQFEVAVEPNQHATHIEYFAAVAEDVRGDRVAVRPPAPLRLEANGCDALHISMKEVLGAAQVMRQPQHRPRSHRQTHTAAAHTTPPHTGEHTQAPVSICDICAQQQARTGVASAAAAVSTTAPLVP